MSTSESIRELARRLEPTKSAQLGLLADEVAELEKRAVPERWTPYGLDRFEPFGPWLHVVLRCSDNGEDEWLWTTSTTNRHNALIHQRGSESTWQKAIAAAEAAEEKTV